MASISSNRDLTFFCSRGKRFVKQIGDEDSDEDDPDDLGLFAGREHLLPDPSVLRGRTLRRKDYKPRMLWGPGGTAVATTPREATPETKDEPEPAHKPDNEDEATDEEDDMAMDSLEPIASGLETSATPADDPANLRKLRSNARTTCNTTETPCRDETSSSSKSKQTPFHAWLRKKKGPDDASSAASSPKSTTTAAKRDANDEPVGSPAKRTRGNAAQSNSA